MQRGVIRAHYFIKDAIETFRYVRLTNEIQQVFRVSQTPLYGNELMSGSTVLILTKTFCFYVGYTVNRQPAFCFF